ncbi:cation:proton antiporter [Enterobacteriaceae bacterium H18W14]|uniref:cation:proton antiporter n=1 Tax=Dryocola boscaweniae TaxID=2925397 RepID=UPI0022F13F5E|nr:cation:proton antiporter [Dryocola boscaweniae]MCT4714429.1 cation:proton antiporter [Dryocola boscaweniae]
MNFITWTAASGALLLLMSLSYGWISRSVVPLFGLYLLVGIVCGPWVLNLLNIDIFKYSTIIAHVSEVAMAASLFMTGLKIRMPFRSAGWKMGVLLAGPAMLLTVGSIMLAAHYLLGMNWPISLAFAAIIAPTDPVLASLIAINDARDDDSLRLSLSTEAGMNDGTALPLLALALMFANSGGEITSPEIAHWFTIEVVWALVAGVVIGYLLGHAVGLMATHFRYTQREFASSDFIALSLIALSYAIALALGASGFLAAFAAGVGLRRAEIKVQRHFPEEREEENGTALPAETMVNPHQRHAFSETTRVKSMGLVIGDALSFGDTVERLFAATLIIILGITLAQHWQPDGLLMAALLFVVIRPLAVYAVTWGVSTPAYQRMAISWLGIRGIGSLNYIAYAWMHGMRGDEANYMMDCALTLVVASVIVHGISVNPLMALRRKKMQ